MSNNKSVENRQYKRWDIFEYALVYKEGDQSPEPAIIVDLSLGGMQARSRRQYDAGEVCLISITDDENEQITTHAEVRYSYPLQGTDLHSTGLRFMPGSVEQRVALVNYIHQRFRNDIESIAI